MQLIQLMGQHLRLQWELEAAYSSLPWQTECIDRLANELAATERELATLRSAPPIRRVDQLTSPDLQMA
jgi:hypothetical protein